MELTHRVTVAAPLDRVGAALDDLTVVAHCFPGAGLAGRDGDRIDGVLRLKLGTLGLAFAGSGTYVAGTLGGRGVLVTGRGDDRRGNGAVAITVRATVEQAPDDPTGTVITARTELALTGRAGRFGHGMITDAHDRMLDQFADRLTARLGREPAIETVRAAAAPPETPETPEPVSAAVRTDSRRYAAVALVGSVTLVGVALVVRVVSRRR